MFFVNTNFLRFSHTPLFLTLLNTKLEVGKGAYNQAGGSSGNHQTSARSCFSVKQRFCFVMILLLRFLQLLRSTFAVYLSSCGLLVTNRKPAMFVSDCYWHSIT